MTHLKRIMREVWHHNDDMVSMPEAGLHTHHIITATGEKSRSQLTHWGRATQKCVIK